LPLCRLRFARGWSDAAPASHVGHDPSQRVRVPFQCQAGLPLTGPIIGQEVLAKACFCYDPFCLYETETLLSPCMLVSGNKGYGKSAFVKAYLHRQSMAGKWLASWTRRASTSTSPNGRLSVLSLRPGGPVRLNPLDAGPALAGPGPKTSGVAASVWWSHSQSRGGTARVE